MLYSLKYCSQKRETKLLSDPSIDGGDQKVKQSLECLTYITFVDTKKQVSENVSTALKVQALKSRYCWLR